MPCLVLDLRGIPLPRRMEPSRARREVSNGAAQWVHAEGVAPNPRYGSIQLRRVVRDIQPPRRVAVLAADGILLGWVQSAYARRYMRDGLWAPVGDPADIHAVIIPRVLAPDQIRELAQLEGWIACRRALLDAAIRTEIEALAARLAADPDEAAVVAAARLGWAGDWATPVRARRAIDDLLALRGRRLRALRQPRPSVDVDYGHARKTYLAASQT